MTWFKVDDSFHSHPKALSTSLAAIGLWTVAGSWSGDHLTDGFVPDHVVSLLSRGAINLADELVAAGLWRRTRNGYKFHEWNVDVDGTRRNPTAMEVKTERAKKAAAGRKGGLASAKTRSKRQARASAGAKQVLADSFNPRPDPTIEGSTNLLLVNPTADAADLDREFDESFWPDYPRKVRKADALKAFKRARKTTELKVILDGLAAYEAAVRHKEAEYIAHAATWLNGQRWHDETDRPSAAETASNAWWEN